MKIAAGRVLGSSVLLHDLLGGSDVLGHGIILGHAGPSGPRVVLGLALHVEEPGSVVGVVADGAILVEPVQL